MCATLVSKSTCSSSSAGRGAPSHSLAITAAFRSASPDPSCSDRPYSVSLGDDPLEPPHSPRSEGTRLRRAPPPRANWGTTPWNPRIRPARREHASGAPRLPGRTGGRPPGTPAFAPLGGNPPTARPASPVELGDDPLEPPHSPRAEGTRLRRAPPPRANWGTTPWNPRIRPARREHASGAPRLPGRTGGRPPGTPAFAPLGGNTPPARPASPGETELRIKAQPQPVQGAQPQVPATLVPVGAGQRGPGQLDHRRAQRLGRERRRLAPHHAQRGPLGLLPAEQVEQHVAAEPRGTDAQPGIPGGVGQPPAVGGAEEHAEPRAGVDHAAPGVREAEPFELREGFEELPRQPGERRG